MSHTNISTEVLALTRKTCFIPHLVVICEACAYRIRVGGWGLIIEIIDLTTIYLGSINHVRILDHAVLTITKRVLIVQHRLT